MSGAVTQTGVDTATSSQFSTPIPRLQTKGNSATVMELLWIDGEIEGSINGATEGITVIFYGGVTTTTSFSWNNPRLIARKEFSGNNIVTSGSIMPQPDFKLNLTSKDGYGFLFAGDVVNVLVTSANTGVATVVNWRLYYRFVDIPITEFVGLVQSQSQGSS